MFIRHLAVLGALAVLVMAHPSTAKKSKSKSAKHTSKKPKSESLTMAHPSTAKKTKSKSEKPTSKKHTSKAETSKSKGDDKSKIKADESKSESKKPEHEVEWCHIQKLKLSPSDAASHALQHPQDYPASEGVCIPPLNIGTLYDEGCPCFHEEDLDAFLSFAAGADDCSYSEYTEVFYTSLSLYANFISDDSTTISRSFTADDYADAGGFDYCSSSVYATDGGTGPSDIDGTGDGSESNYAYLVGSYASECQSLIEGVKGKLKALGCVFYSYPCPYTCMYGDCTAEGCNCYPGWTGDSCDECDQTVCVNGVCTDYGCACDDRWTGNTCTECEYGWTGINCDECDPSVCLNGVCTDSGCACDDNWTGPYCDTCDVGWTGVNCDECDFGWVGNNCDACDPQVCADGYCSSCVHGQCTGSGCVCDTDWYGDKCDRVYDEGCPCFNEADVDTFLNFAAIAGADPSRGSCSYEDGTSYFSLYAYINTAAYGIAVTATQCNSFRTYGRDVPIDEVESGECRDVIVNAGAKDQMADAGCYIYEY